MRYRLELVAALAAVACSPVVDVYRLHPSPHFLVERTAASVAVYEALPENGVAVYGFDAYNGSPGALQTAVQVKAASMGCDGVVISQRHAPARGEGVSATGQITERRELIEGHVSALCVVLAK
jgi:hypothetical protein